jgi:hypothetical protein
LGDAYISPDLEFLALRLIARTVEIIDSHGFVLAAIEWGHRVGGAQARRITSCDPTVLPQLAMLTRHYV